VLTGPVDTDMPRGIEIPKASPRSVARAIFDGVEKRGEDIFPDPMSESLAKSWRRGGATAQEREYAVLVAAEPVRSYPKGKIPCDFGTVHSTCTAQTHDEPPRP
jgi:hypothetical protein